MNKRNLFVLLSLLSMPTGYLWAAAESAEGRARREAQEAAERALIDQALLVDSAGFSEDDMRRAKAQSLGLDDTEEKVKEESAGVVLVHIEDYKKFRMQEGVINVGDKFYSIALSPDDTIVALVMEDDIYLYAIDVETGKQVIMLKGHTYSVMSVAFSPDSQQVVSGAMDNTVRIWDAATGECIKVLQGHTYIVNSVAFSPCGQQVVSGSIDHTVCIWNVATGECVKTLQAQGNPVFSVVFSPDGQYIASGLWGDVCIWNVVTGECIKILQGHSDQVNSVAFSPCGEYIVSGSHDKTVRIWHVATGKCIKILQGYDCGVRSVAFSPDGQFIASGSSDGMVRIWDVAAGECIKTLQGHENTVFSVLFSSDGRHVVSGSLDDKTVRIWDILAAKGSRKRMKAVCTCVLL